MPMRPSPPRAVPLRTETTAGAAGPAGRGGLLIVEDDESMRVALEYFFRDQGFAVEGAASVGAAEALLGRRTDWRLAIADYNLPDGTGWDLCRRLRDGPAPALPFLLISGAFLAGELAPGIPLLVKPFSPEQLTASVEALLRGS